MNDINISLLSIAHIITKNPIIHDDLAIKKEYIKRLNELIKSGGWDRRKFENAELKAYEKIILEAESRNETHTISYYKYYILFDVFHILGYEIKNSDVKKLEKFKLKYLAEFSDANIDDMVFDSIVKTFISNDHKKIKRLTENSKLSEEREYIQLIRDNNLFKKEPPVSVMVTATMSAGKSTFINALVGKYVCLSQNMACTSKIHCIVNKAFEDGYAYEYDHDLVMTAGREELLNDNELNLSDKIIVGTHFHGLLSNQRVIVNDSPGVNYSGDAEHKLITDRLIKGKNYNLLIYVMNATQLATNDEDEHLDFIKQSIGRRPIIFLINKIDAFNVEEENINAAIYRQISYLKEKGFKYPIVCPLSSRAGYLAKHASYGNLTRSEERELYNYVDKFEKMELPKYYEKAFRGIKIEDTDQEEKNLLKTCGLAYVEKIIKLLVNGGKINGTVIC